MNTTKFKYSIISIGVLIIVLFLILKQMNKEHINVEESSPDLIISVDQILSDYQNDEQQANKLYTDKIVQLKGEISKISMQDGNATFTLISPNFDVTVICSLQAEENTKVLSFKKGDEISLKGICTGYLLDVVLVNCVILNRK